MSILDRLLAALFAPEAAGIWMPLLLGGLVALIRATFKDKAAKALDALDVATSHAYFATTEYVERRRARGETVGPALDKATIALGYFSDYLKRELAREPTQDEIAKARLAWSAMHGEERIKRQLAAPKLDLQPARSRA